MSILPYTSFESGSGWYVRYLSLSTNLKQSPSDNREAHVPSATPILARKELSTLALLGQPAALDAPLEPQHCMNKLTQDNQYEEQERQSKRL
jgi:hypothetical protein